jgi:penicillin-insensitive murein endopeptidase
MSMVFKIVLLGCTLAAGACFAQITHHNTGESLSVGDYNKGSLRNGYLLPRTGKNFQCYSWSSYYLLGREYTNSRVYRTVLATYQTMEARYPGRRFIYMESARRNGGRPFPHRTHQNGLSIDFMSPLVMHGQPKYYNGLGLFRYALSFDDTGKSTLNPAVKIDFEVLANHLLQLEKHARKNGLMISKIILRIELKDELFATDSGKKLKASGIYFAQNLTPVLNNAHDDHYHVDFKLL